MNRKILQQLKAAEGFLNKKDISEARRCLDGLTNEALSEKDKALVCLLKAEIALHCNEYGIDEILQHALDYYKYSSDTARYARAKYLHGWLLTERGDFADAREVLLEAYVHFKRCDLFPQQARTLNRLGFLSFHLGEIETAIRQLRHAERIYTELDDAGNVSIVVTNIATLYYYIGNAKDAIAAYEAMADTLSADDTKRCHYYLNYALPYALQGDFDAAHQKIKKAVPHLKDYVREQAIYYENLGWIHLLEEDYPAAEKALLQGLDISLRIAPESALVSQIKRRLADACFGQSKYDQAQKYADEGLAVAEKIGERVEIAACWRVYAQLENHRGHQSTAREWFTKAIDIFSMIGSRYELAATRYLAAVSGIYQNGERQALLYLARAYFDSEDVVPYLTKIDHALKKLPSPPARPNDKAPVVIAESVSMRKLIDLARHVAQSDMTILLTGPTGTGKDLLADYIHYHSGRTGKFVPVNTAAIPDTMVEAELFGHRKGAYTGAGNGNTGLIDQAAGGTLYLNEIADSSLEFQAKLLDVLERRRVRPLGGREDHAVNFRLIAASNRDLAELVRQNKFRADLYHRLNQVNLALPPLDDRKEDIPALVRHFVTMGGIKLGAKSSNGTQSPVGQLIATLTSRHWEGNVRALKAEVDYLALTCKRDLVRMAAMAAVRVPIAASDADVGQETDKDRLVRLLEETNWNRREVARRLGVSEGKVRYQIVKYGLNCTIKS